MESNEMELIRVSLRSTEKGINAYFVYRLPVQRGIRGKTRSKVNEILAFGVPASMLQEWCNKHHYTITNYYVYQDEKILLALNKEGTAYV